MFSIYTVKENRRRRRYASGGRIAGPARGGIWRPSAFRRHDTSCYAGPSAHGRPTQCRLAGASAAARRRAGRCGGRLARDAGGQPHVAGGGGTPGTATTPVVAGLAGAVGRGAPGVASRACAVAAAATVSTGRPEVAGGAGGGTAAAGDGGSAATNSGGTPARSAAGGGEAARGGGDKDGARVGGLPPLPPARRGQGPAGDSVAAASVVTAARVWDSPTPPSPRPATAEKARAKA